MSDDDKLGLKPASALELQESLSFALRYAGRKRVHLADDAMARITAEPKGVMFITIEDETGVANLVLWADRF